MDAVERWREEQREAERLKAQESRLEGAADEVLRRLKDDHGCKNAAASQKKVKALEAEADALEAEAEAELDRLEAERG